MRIRRGMKGIWGVTGSVAQLSPRTLCEMFYAKINAALNLYESEVACIIRIQNEARLAEL